MAWARGFDACISCNTTKFKHHAAGLCVACHARIWRKKNPGKVKTQSKRSYIRNYVLRNDEVLARRRKRYRENAEHRAASKANSRRQYEKNPQAYKDRAAARREAINRPAFERWKKLVLKRDNHTCTKCGRTKPAVTLEAHHLNGKGWDHRLENGTTLCSFCHKALPMHRRRKYTKVIHA